jgi:hypothetical protein
MKRKRTSSSANFLKIHALLFTIFTLLMTHSMLATFTYPSNTLLSFDHFKFFVIERVTLILLWAVVLVIHFGIHYIRSGFQARQDVLDTHHLEAPAEETHEAEAYPDVRKAKLH